MLSVQPPVRMQPQQSNGSTYFLWYTVRSESHCALRLRYVDLVVTIEVAVEVCCCCVTFQCVQLLNSGWSAILLRSWIAYFLNPCSRVLLEKLTGSAASQEIPRIFRTRRFLTVLTSARHLSLYWANSIQSPQPPPTSCRSILILSSHLRLGLPNGLFPSGFPTRTLCTPLPWCLPTRLQCVHLRRL
jgi:hypothetical protein